MNANDIISDAMSLDEKLAAIEQAMINKQAQSDIQRKAQGLAPMPVDPADVTICDGCE